MTVEQLTTTPTELDFEASIHNVTRRVFPWLAETSIRHQTRFSFKVGHKEVEIDGKKQYAAIGIADIILRHEDGALAVLELKRNGIKLTTDDEEQGLSYARMLAPPAPLVIVTNGQDTRIIATHTGKPWDPAEPSASAFAHLVKCAAQIAADDIKRAVETLMGTNPQVWRQAMRLVTKHNMDELTGDWGDFELPFAKKFLFPRQATRAVLQRLFSGDRLVIVEGPPMVGKSSILREVAMRTLKPDGVGVLFIEFDSGRGIFETLADTLEQALGWPVTREEARTWLKRVSHLGATRIWILVDGFVNNQSQGQRDIEDLSSGQFGEKLAVVVAMDDSVAERAVLTENGRGASQMGRRATRVSLGLLTLEEFETAKASLERQRVSFINGAQLTYEYRQPWMLRAVATAALRELEKTDEGNFIFALPPFQGFDLMEVARKQFNRPDDRRLFALLALALLVEVEDKTRAAQLILRGCDVFLIRDAALDFYVDSENRRELISRGFVKSVVLPDGGTGVVVRLPELLACEVARALEARISEKAHDPDDLAAWLCSVAGLMPLGDVIVARALFDKAQSKEGLKSDVIEALFTMAPTREPELSLGTKVMLLMPDGSPVELTITEDGATATLSDGTTTTFSREEGEWSGQTYSNVYPWLVLSYLAELPFVVEVDDKQYRVDLKILLDIGSAAMVLRKNGSDPELQTLPLMDIDDATVVAQEAGIIEPITHSILKFFMRREDCVEHWIDEAIMRKSYPLLCRMHAALNQARLMANGDLASWAKLTLSSKIHPAIHELFKSKSKSSQLKDE